MGQQIQRRRYGRFGRRGGDLKTLDFVLLATTEHESFCPGTTQHPVGCAACPCGNDPAPMTNAGCLNASGTAGTLSGVGTASTTVDDLRFYADTLNPTAVGILVSADLRLPRNPAHPCFGDDTGVPAGAFNGRRCIGQNLRRHGMRTTDAKHKRCEAQCSCELRVHESAHPHTRP